MNDKKEKKPRLSRELIKIFKQAYDSSRNLQLKAISAECLSYYFWKHVFEEEVDDEVDNKTVRSFLSDVSEDTKKVILDGIEGDYEKSTDKSRKTTFDDSWYSKSSLVLDDLLESIVREAEDITDANFPERFGRIESDVLLYCLLDEDEDLNSMYLAQLNGINRDKLWNTMMKGRSEQKNKAARIVGSMMSALTGEDPEKTEQLMKDIIELGEKEGILKEKRIFSTDAEKSEEDKNSEGENRKFANEEEDDANFEKYGQNNPLSGKELDPNSDTPYLDQFSLDMTSKARNKEYDPVIGRDEVVDQIIEVLCRRKKSNCALVGVAGSGKTSIVERLAQRIVSGEVPPTLKDKRVCGLNLNDLVAGTQYRGQFEERLQKIIKEVVGNKSVIVFIDELHALVGAGGHEGSGDAATILKPYLARGEFQCIGATTSEEYHKFIEKDAALKRRFTEIEVTEPNAQETLKILKGIQSAYEKFHKVQYTKEAIERCIEWSDRYLTGKNQPDKSIDILDLSGSLVSLRTLGKEEDAEVEEIKSALADVIEEKIKAATETYDFDLLKELKDKEVELQAQLDKKNKEAKKKDTRKNWPVVGENDVAEAVAKIAKIPIEKVNQSDRDKIKFMKAELEKKVIGQQEAVDVIVQSIQLNSLGLRNTRKPICSLLAVGPSGVGKTLICEEVAKIFFGSEKNLVKINGGEYKEEHSLSKLIGAPSGYVGYEDEPLLRQSAKRKSHVLLIDECEKLNKSILDVFLELLERGEVRLANGEVVDFTNAIVIFTGNIGTKEIRDSISIGFGKTRGNGEDNNKERNESIVKKAIDKAFRPEFINRLSNIVVFNELGNKELCKIFNLELDKIKKQLSKNKISIKVSNALRDYVISTCDSNFGARDLNRGITKWVVEPVSKAILDLQETGEDRVTKFIVDFVDDKSVVSLVNENDKE